MRIESVLGGKHYRLVDGCDRGYAHASTARGAVTIRTRLAFVPRVGTAVTSAVMRDRTIAVLGVLNLYPGHRSRAPLRCTGIEAKSRNQ